MNKAQAKLADFLKDSRENAGLSQGYVSKQLGYTTPQFISNWERGISQPPIPILKTLAKMYKVDAKQLFELQLQAAIEVVTNNMTKKFKAN